MLGGARRDVHGQPFLRGRVRGDVEREPLGKRALGGRVSAKIILIDTAYGPFPSKKREAAKTY